MRWTTMLGGTLLARITLEIWSVFWALSQAEVAWTSRVTVTIQAIGLESAESNKLNTILLALIATP
jgi:hypothetical protein